MEDTRSDIGVILCDCGGTLRERLDFERLEGSMKELPSVAAVELCSKFCRADECSRIIKDLSGRNVQRLLIGACERAVYDKPLEEAVAACLLNQGLLWSVNIREHCGWVHPLREGTQKSLDSLKSAVRRLEIAQALEIKQTVVNQDVLVFGGNLAAIQAAVALSALNHRVHLAADTESLGGLPARNPQLYAYLASDASSAELLVRSRMHELLRNVAESDRITVYKSSALVSVTGETGDFTAVIDSGGGRKTISAGALVLTAGLGASPVSTALGGFFENGQQPPGRIAIIMDVEGEQGKAVSAEVLSAAERLAQRKGTEVKLYCRNIRVAAVGLEDLYRRARQAGVVVVKYDSPPAILNDNMVKIYEPVIGREITEQFDLVLTADIKAEGSRWLRSKLEGLRTGPDNELQEDSVWLLPVKTNREGIYAIDASLGKSDLRDIQADALAATQEIHELLESAQVEVLGDEPVVDADKCVLCLTCLRICPHAAVSIDTENEAAVMSTAACRRCGICAARCPAGAIQLPLYTDNQTAEDFSQSPQEPLVTVFACENSALPAATAAAVSGGEYDARVRLIKVPCAGKVDPRDVLHALEAGAERVMILACHQENCQYLTGSTRAARLVGYLENMLEKAGYNGKAVSLRELASVEPGKFLEYVKE